MLAGGTGSRLFPLTKITNKHLLPIYDKPMIYYPIQTLVDAGISEILVVTGGRNSGRLPAAAGQWPGIRIETPGLHLPGRRGRYRRRLGAGRTFRRRPEDLRDFGRQHHRRQRSATAVEDFKQQPSGAKILLKEVPDAERFGVAEIRDGRIAGIEEKPKQPKSNYAVIGIYMYDETVFEKVRVLVPSGRGELEITDVNNAYIREGSMTYSHLDGWWTDAGTFESLLRAANLVAETRTKSTEPVLVKP